MDTNVDVLQDLDVLVGSVSSGDQYPVSVSGGDTIYIINAALPSEQEAEIVYTLWDKPLEEYTVSEGLLLLLVIIALAALIWTAIKGGFKWLT